MKIINISKLLALTALLSSAFGVEAATLNIGDPAPKLEVSKWVQGEPVTELKSGTPYIVEFWATWCGPCRATIPHLNQIYLKYKDKGLVVIGQDVWEKETTKVEPFVKQMGTNMTYRVALDSIPDGQEPNEGKMAQNWMAAADANGIPTAFLVDKTGTIAWIGHPMELKETTLDAVIAGTFDLKKAKEEYEKEQANQKELQKQSQALFKSINSKNWDEATTAVEAIEKLLPAEQKSALIPIRLQILQGKGDTNGLNALATKAIDEIKNAEQLNSIAWGLVSTKSPNKSDIDLSLKLATKADELSSSKNAAIIDTLARATFLSGDTNKAVELQTKAVELAQDNDKKELQKTLDSYKTGKLPSAK